MANDPLRGGWGSPASGRSNSQSGLVRFASQLEREGHVGDVPSSGMGQAVAGLSGEFGRIGAKIGALADHAASVEGREAGRLAGLDPEFRATGEMTIRGEAYDQAGLQVAETRTRTAMLADMEAAFDQHGNDPAALNKALTEKRAGWIGGVDPKIRPDIETSFDGAALRLTREAQRAHVARIAAEQQAAAQTEGVEGMKRAHQLAYASGLDAIATEALVKERAVFARTLSRTDPQGNPLFTPEQRRTLLKQFDDTTTTARVLGAFERLPGLAAKQKFIEEFEADFAASRGFAKQYDLGGFQAVTSQLRNGLDRDQTGARIALRRVGQTVDGILSELKSGGTVPTDQLARIEAEITTLGGGSAELLDNVSKVRTVFTLQSDVRTKTPEEIEALAAGVRDRIAGGGISPELAVARDFLEGYAQTARTELAKDPLGWAERTRKATVPPLDFSSPEILATSLKARIPVGDEVGVAFGRAPVYVHPDEAAEIGLRISQGGNQAIKTIGAVVAGAGDRAPSILSAVEKQGGRLAAGLGWIVAGDGGRVAPIAKEIADGIAYMKDLPDGKRRGPKPKEMRTAAAGAIGAALSEMGSFEQTALNLADAAYEMDAVRNRRETFDEGVWQEKLHAVLGRRVVDGNVYGGVVLQTFAQSGDWFGSRQAAVVVPQNVKASRFRELLDAVTIEDLPVRPRGADGGTATLEQIRSRGILKSIGDGRYWVSMGDPGDGDPAWLGTAEPGEPFVLDLKALEPVLRRRRPDLYLGGGQ